MSDDAALLAAACERLAEHGPIQVNLDVSQVIELIAVVQLASRHPAAKFSDSIQRVIGVARQIQDAMAAQEPEIGRLLERGWHEVFDQPTERR